MDPLDNYFNFQTKLAAKPSAVEDDDEDDDDVSFQTVLGLF